MKVTIDAPLHPAQQIIHNSPARFRVACCGRRFGKTRLGVSECLQAAAMGGRAWWIAPSYKVARLGWRPISRIAARVPLASISKSEMTVYMPSGGEISIRSADNPDALRGEGLDFVVLDEAAYIMPEAWYQAVRPALADRLGRALFISTPSGRNWFWEIYQHGIRGDDGWASFQFPTSASTKIAQSEIEAARQEMTELDFQQEFLAEFVDRSGGVFRQVMEAATSTPSKREDGHQYVAGVDIAAALDYTVISVIDAQEKRQVFMDRFNRIDYPLLVERLKAVYDKYHLISMIVEANSIGQTVVDYLYEAGLPVQPFTTTQATKAEIIRELSTAFEYNQIRILNDPILINELLSYQATKSKAGLLSYSAQPGMHDDTVISLALAWYGVAGGRPVVLFEM